MRRVDYKEFQAAWNSSASANEAAEKCGITVQGAYRRARTARKKGYELQYFSAEGTGSGGAPMSEEEIKSARKMYENGYTILYICNQLERSPKTVRKGLGGMYDPERDSVTKFSPRDSAAQRVAPFLPEIWGKCESGMSLEEIASEYQIAPRYLGNLLRHHDYPVGGREESGRYGVSAVWFVDAWQTANTFEDIVEELPMPRSAIIARATNYRRQGVPLKEFPAEASRIDWKQLKELAESYRATSENS